MVSPPLSHVDPEAPQTMRPPRCVTRENTGPRSSNAEAFLRNNYYYGQQLGWEESFARKIPRELLYQNAIILCQIALSVENRKR